MQKITPHLWFDKEAKEAAEFYVSVFNSNPFGSAQGKSKITNVATLHDTPSGDVDVVSFELSGQAFMAISAGPLFKFNPSVSFHVKCKTKEEVDAIWEKLSEEGTVLMELGEYPFSERYGWLQDKYGLSWQVIFVGKNEIKQKITPALMFVGEAYGKAEEAVNFYASVFPSAKTDILARYGKGEEPDKEGTVKYAAFELFGQEFGAMDSAHKHDFAFNEAISFQVPCDTQEEVDYYWHKLSEGGDEEAQQCGWLKDKYGVSWQVVPTILSELVGDPDSEKSQRAMKAMLQMKKMDIEALERAYEGR